MRTAIYSASVVGLMAVALAGCGGGGDDNDGGGGTGGGGTGGVSYAVGGEVLGLGAGKTVVLQNNGGDDLRKNANGKFEFGKRLAAGQAYQVRVSTQPAGQSCTVANGSGTVSAAVSNVKVTCQDTGGTTPPPSGGSDMQACFPQSLYTVGRSWNFKNDRGADFTDTVLAPTTYRGNASWQVRSDIRTAGVNETSTAYFIQNNGMGYTFGNVVTGGLVNMEIYNEPAAQMPLNLALNESRTHTYSQRQISGSSDITVTVTESVAYRGRETITVPAGTFEACVIDTTTSLSGPVSREPYTVTTWRIASGKFAGLLARTAGKEASGYINLANTTELTGNW